MVMFGLYIVIALRSEINFLVIFEEHIFNGRGSGGEKWGSYVILQTKIFYTEEL